jgi:hypothetical protein
MAGAKGTPMSSYANQPATTATTAAIPSVLPHLFEKFGGATLVYFSSACEVLGIAEQTGRNLYARNEFPVPTVRVGGARKVAISALAAFVDAAASGVQVDFNFKQIGFKPEVAFEDKPAAPERLRGGTREERAEAKALGIKVSELRKNKAASWAAAKAPAFASGSEVRHGN